MLTWMAYAALVGAIVAAAALALERLAAATGRPRRFAWLAALTLAVLIPLTGALRRPEAPVAPPASEAPVMTETVTAARWTIVPRLPLPTGRDTARTADYAWAVGSAAALTVLAALLTAVARARRRWPRRLVDGTPVRVSRRFGPALVGITRPDIVLPAWVLGLRPAARAAIVRHEAEHARARDHLVLLCGGLVLAAFPWSPAIWWMCRRLRAAVEIDCDRRVIASGIAVADYGAVLLDAGSRSHARWGFAPAMGQPKSLLERRLRTMSEKRGRVSRSQVVVLSVAALVALAIACDAPAPTQIEEIGDEAAMGSQAIATGEGHGGNPGFAGILWEDYPVVEWDRVRLVQLSASTPGERSHPLLAYRNETSVEFANRLMAVGIPPGAYEYDPDLRVETIKVEADHIRLEGNRLIARGGTIKVVSNDPDNERDWIYLDITEEIVGNRWGGYVFWSDHLAIMVPDTRSELVEALRVLRSPADDGTE